MKTAPYWWDDIAFDIGDSADRLPEDADVFIVGSGYSGCSAALTLAREGRRPLVADAMAIGAGASSRNGGQVRGAVKADTGALVSAYGAELAAMIQREAEAAFDFAEQRIAELELPTDYTRCGAFIGAHSPAAFDAMRKRLDGAPDAYRSGYRLVEKAGLTSELRSDIYHGGLVVERAGGIHPARYHKALATACLGAGTAFYRDTRVTAIERRPGGGFSITCQDANDGTHERKVQARDVIVATNGYSTKVTPWLASRLIPVKSFMIATEPLGDNKVRDLIPNLRMIADTKRVLYYYRPSPDGQRILFGGRASFADPPLEDSGRKLRAFMLGVFPDLKEAAITHSWSGYVAFAEDFLPHFGEVQGIHYAAPYNGSGVAMATYLGHRVALRLLGLAAPGSSLDAIPHKAPFPGYSGKPWFLPIVGQYYKLRDWMDRRGV